jgi:predicted  nucleic acid-binding Zn-ribbon protein
MAEITRKDLFDTLNEFYGKVLEPRFDRIEKRLDEHDQKFTDIFEHFDKIYTRFDRLETEYYSIVAAIDRVEQRFDRIEGGTR